MVQSICANSLKLRGKVGIDTNNAALSRRYIVKFRHKLKSDGERKPRKHSVFASLKPENGTVREEILNGGLVEGCIPEEKPPAEEKVLH